MSLQWVFFGLTVASAGCGGAEQERIERTITLTADNRTGWPLYYFQYSDCGAEDWWEVIPEAVYIADGDTVSERNLPPGCYDLYAEDECGCFAYFSTDGNVAGGMEFTWKLTEAQFTCDNSTGC